MKIKHALVALVATGGTAGLAFGGSAVSTAFTAQQTVNATVGGASVKLSADSSFAIANLVPGGHQSTSFNVKTSTTTTTDMYVNVGNPYGETAGSNGQPPNMKDLYFQVKDTDGYVNTPTYNWAQLNNHWTQVAQSIPAGTYTDSVTVTVWLAQSAGNDWNGAAGTIPVTLHLQDNSGSDANGYVATSNG